MKLLGMNLGRVSLLKIYLSEHERAFLFNNPLFKISKAVQ